MAIWTDPATRIKGSGEHSSQFVRAPVVRRGVSSCLEPVPRACHAVRTPVVRRGVSSCLACMWHGRTRA
jgi:hypothetical protein